MTVSFITGVWEGHFVYGKEYEPVLRDQPVQFRMHLHAGSNGQFEGRCIELSGSTANPDIAKVKGFLEGNFISFVKEYPVYYQIDDKGNSIPIKTRPTPMISYGGNYDWDADIYSGYWEFDFMDGRWIADTGTWEMRKIS